MKWKEEMNLVELPLPTQQYVKRKEKEITEAKGYAFTDKDIEKMVEEKEKFRRKPLNYAVRKNKLMRDKDIAEQAHDFEEVTRLREKLEELEEDAEKLDKRRSGALSNVSFINERNRKKNVYEAEKAAIQEGKDGKVSALGGDNPFIRRRCLSQLGADLTKLLAEKPGEQIPDTKQKKRLLLLSQNPLKRNPKQQGLNQSLRLRRIKLFNRCYPPLYLLTSIQRREKMERRRTKIYTIFTTLTFTLKFL